MWIRGRFQVDDLCPVIHKYNTIDDLINAITVATVHLTTYSLRIDGLHRVYSKTRYGKLNSPEGKLNNLEGKLNNPEGKLNSLEGKLNSPEGKLNNLKGKTNNAYGKIHYHEWHDLDITDWKVIGTFLSTAPIYAISIDFTDINDEIWHMLEPSLMTMRTLSFIWSISNIVYLTNVIKHGIVRRLNIERYSFTEEDIICLVDAVRDSTIVELYLTGEISDCSVKYISQVLYNRTVHIVNYCI